VSEPAASRPSEFVALTCSAPDERAARMAEIVLRHAPAGATRVLDLGCGTGGLLFRLAASLDEATCIGLDVSAANIAAAEAARPRAAGGDRITLELADYLEWSAPPVDVIAIDGVLHLIPGDTEPLVAKLARGLKPGGVIVNSMPHACVYNTLFAVARRALRSTRSAASDAAILSIGRILHPDMSDALLRERVHYMYLPPQRLMDRHLEAAFAHHGLSQIATYPMKSTSLAQLRHSVSVLRKNF
jgi:trans-aconitate methyltransferase